MEVFQKAHFARFLRMEPPNLFSLGRIAADLNWIDLSNELGILKGEEHKAESMVWGCTGGGQQPAACSDLYP